MSIPLGWDLPQEIKVRLSRQLGRQRTMVAKRHILMILHHAPKLGELTRDGIYLWRNPNGQWKSSQRGAALGTLKEMIQVYDKKMNQLESEFQRSSTAEVWFKILDEAGPLHRAIQNLYGVLQAAREAIPEIQDRGELQGFCDEASDIVRGSEQLLMEAKHAVEFSAAKQMEVQALQGRELQKSGHRLNVMAAIFLPLTAIASVFGMNLNSGLQKMPPAFFWAVPCIGLLVGWIMGANYSD